MESYKKWQCFVMCFEKWRLLKLRKKKRHGEGKSAAWLVKGLSLETCFQNKVVFFTSSCIFFLFNACTITILKYVTIKCNKNVFNNFQTNLLTNGNYNCYSTYVHFDSFYLNPINHVHSPEIKYIVNCISKQINYVIHKEDFFLQFQKNTSWF